MSNLDPKDGPSSAFNRGEKQSGPPSLRPSKAGEIWMICLTLAMAVAGIISAVIFVKQLSVMQGQLAEMKSTSIQTDRSIAEFDRIASAAQNSALAALQAIAKFERLVEAAQRSAAASETSAQAAALSVAQFERLANAANVQARNSSIMSDASRRAVVVTTSIAFDANYPSPLPGNSVAISINYGNVGKEPAVRMRETVNFKAFDVAVLNPDQDLEDLTENFSVCKGEKVANSNLVAEPGNSYT
jgi:hypothetical protein